MKELVAENISLTYGEKTLFDSITFKITEHEKIGLIGDNGSGKTHLLNVLANEIKPESGSIRKPGDYTIGYLKQQPDLDADATVLEAVFAGDNSIMHTVREYEQALRLLEKDVVAYQDRFAKAEERMNAENAWNAEAQAKAILTNLKILDLDAQIKNLSGGQAKRVGLAQVLIQAPDLLLLDEPTNHLDIQSIQWLENYLSTYKGALLMVTHDRYFLERVVGQIIELGQGQIQVYTGNYETYLNEKAEREEIEEKKEHKKSQMYKQELAWMRKGPRARGTKQEARKQRFEELAGSLKKDDNSDGLEFNLSASHIGKKVIELKEVSFKWGDQPILSNFNLLIQNRDRIGITGKNGAGKTTFLDLIAQYKEADSGIIDIGETIKVAYYTQNIQGLDEDKRVIQFLQEIAEEVYTGDGHRLSVSQLLEKFLFPKYVHGALISNLSGGEKKRLYLLSLLMEQPNVLLLDEPTNDLDLATLRVLEDFIDTFNGVVISVSHDRYYLDKTSNKLLVFKGEGEVDQYLGSLTDYYEEMEEEKQLLVKERKMKQQSQAAKNSPNQQKTDKKEKTKLTFKEKHEWETIEDDLFAIEEKIEGIEEKMVAASSDFAKIQELENERMVLKAQFEEKMVRWEYLSQYAES